jgi:hypothetical protein
MAALDKLDELVDHLARFLHLAFLAFEGQLVSAEPDRAVEPIAERLQYAVAHARELCSHFVRDVQDFLH